MMFSFFMAVPYSSFRFIFFHDASAMLLLLKSGRKADGFSERLHCVMILPDSEHSCIEISGLGNFKMIWRIIFK